jgi:hypothetical protein
MAANSVVWMFCLLAREKKATRCGRPHPARLLLAAGRLAGAWLPAAAPYRDAAFGPVCAALGQAVRGSSWRGGWVWMCWRVAAWLATGACPEHEPRRSIRYDLHSLRVGRVANGARSTCAAVLDQHFAGGSRSGGDAGSASPWEQQPPTATAVGRSGPAWDHDATSPWEQRRSSAADGRRVLRIGFLECEDLKPYLSAGVFNTHGGYYKMNCSVFDYVSALSASELAAHGVTDDGALLPGSGVRVEFEVFNCQAGALPRPEDLSRFDGFLISGSLAGVCGHL